MHMPQAKERLTTLGAELVPDAETTPQYLAGLVKSEIAKWATPIEAAGVRVE
jgi:Zn-dependent M28 family amino/carboxypeptidase